MTHSREIQIRLPEIIPGAEKRFAGNRCNSIGDTVSEIERSGMMSFAVAHPCGEGSASVLFTERDHSHLQFEQEAGEKGRSVTSETRGADNARFHESRRADGGRCLFMKAINDRLVTRLTKNKGYDRRRVDDHAPAGP